MADIPSEGCILPKPSSLFSNGLSLDVPVGDISSSLSLTQRHILCHDSTNLWVHVSPDSILVHSICRNPCNSQTQDDSPNKAPAELWLGIFAYTCVMFMHVQQIGAATAIITTPSVLAFALSTLASQLLLAFINILTTVNSIAFESWWTFATLCVIVLTRQGYDK